jgi:uncharacterized protein YndB with AHSA1/START domain
MTQSSFRISVTRRFNAAAGHVFDAWLDAKTAGSWWFATPAGTMKRVEIDPKVGGLFLIVERRGAIDAEHFGDFIELDRPRRLVFDFATDRTHEPTRVTVEIADLKGSGCDLTLSHDLNPEWAAYKDRTIQGWTMILEGLGRTLASHDQ